MENNEIFSIIRVGTYEQYEKNIVVVDIDCCNEYKGYHQHFVQK